MPLQTKSYQQFLSDIVTNWASILFLSPNLQSGSPLLAIFQSHVLCGLLFIQSQAVRVNKLTRAATSDGADLDSFMADFSFPRKPSAFATGEVQFSLRQVSNVNLLISPGAIIQTTNGKVQYKVIADTNQAGWSPSQNAYVLPAASLYVNASVQALVAGTSSNVQANTLKQMASPITGVHFVTNLASIMNGAEPESDSAYRDRFKLFINAVNARTTPTGILSAALNTPGVIAASLIENEDQFGFPRPGYGVVVIDDGSGEPSSDLIGIVTEAIASTYSPVRGFTIQILVIGPVLEEVEIALNVKLLPGANEAAVLQVVKLAVMNYINSLSIADPLYLENLSFIARGADPNVVAVQPGSVMINDEEADFPASAKTVIRTNTNLTVIGTY